MAEPSNSPSAVQRTGWTPGLVWAVPFAAAIIAGYLGVQYLARRGVEVVVTFPSAPGVRAGATQVVYQGIEAGHVTGVDLNKDGRRVDVTLELTPRAKPVLTTGTVFYLVGVKPDLSDPGSLRSAISGVTIGAYPSRKGAPTRRFVGLEAPPPVAPGTPGTRLTLWAADVGTVKADTKVTYHGSAVGKVLGVRLAGLHRMRVDVFVQAPFDRLLRPSSRFWTVNTIDVSVSPGGLSARVDPDALLGGEIAFDTPQEAAGERRVASGSETSLFEDQAHAAVAPRGAEYAYLVRFDEPVANLSPGAPVTMAGVPIGRVTKVAFAVDEQTAEATTDVEVGLAPRALGLGEADDAAPGRSRMDALMARLVARGWRMSLRQSPPVIGGRTLDLERSDRPGRLARDGGTPRLPSTPAASSDLAGRAGRLLDRLDRVPIEDIGRNLDRTTRHLAALTGSPALGGAIRDADAAIGDVRRILGQVEPRIGPLMTSLTRSVERVDQAAGAARDLVSGDGSRGAGVGDAVRELTEAARSLRVLTDYLQRHPEAILKGKRRIKP